jgi:branched-subunit amino acid transport protein
VSLWLLIVAMGALTLALRASGILLLGPRGIPDVVRRALRFVPPAVLAAIVLPELLRKGAAAAAPGEAAALAGLASAFDPARVIAGACAALVAWRTRSVVWTLLVGMIGLVVAQRLLA